MTSANYMLCSDCDRLNAAMVRSTGQPLVRAARESNRLAALVCARCGSPLPEPDATARLLETLAQLSRFGLVGGGPPLLKGRQQR